MKKLALMLTVLALLLLLVEGAARVRHRIQYGSFRRVYLYQRDAQSGLMTPVPGQRTERMSIDSRGFRNPELEVPKPPGRTRIAFLGASTTFCAEASSDEATWPHLVLERLRAEYPEREFDYINAGVGGYTIEISRKNLALRVAPLEPDLIVVYHAVNDISKDTRLLAEEQGVYQGHADTDSWLSRVSLAWYLVEKNLVLKSRQKTAARDTVGRLQFDAQALAAKFGERLGTLLEECPRHRRRRGRGHVLPPRARRTGRGQPPGGLQHRALLHAVHAARRHPGLLRRLQRRHPQRRKSNRHRTLIEGRARHPRRHGALQRLRTLQGRRLRQDGPPHRDGQPCWAADLPSLSAASER